jgi:hypothetical protein
MMKATFTGRLLSLRIASQAFFNSEFRAGKLSYRDDFWVTIKTPLILPKIVENFLPVFASRCIVA